MTLTMVTPSRPPQQTVTFLDDYCSRYQHLFSEVRNYEAFKFLHLGILSELPRKSLPKIARAVGLSNSQSLHHFLLEASLDAKALRQMRLSLIQASIGEEEMILCLDETGDVKKGKTTDYVSRQYIGNLGKTERGIVSVNAYGIVKGITYPLMFKIFKPKNCLKPQDIYQTKPQLAVEILQELKGFGFVIKRVLADSLYGESSYVIDCLEKLKLKFIVAIRSNHGVLMGPGQRMRYNRWKAYQQRVSSTYSQPRYIREIIFGHRRRLRYYQITKGEVPEPTGDNSWYIMTNIEETTITQLAQGYSFRNWIEYGFKQVKNELGWADYRFTNYSSIERWWEIIFSVYLLISLQAQNFSSFEEAPHHEDDSAQFNLGISAQSIRQFRKHSCWEKGENWNRALNHLWLIIQPYLAYHLIIPWLEVFKIPGLRRA